MVEKDEAKDKDDGLPDSENCQAKGFSSYDYELAHCLVEHPLCNFSLNFGSLLLCRHPRRKEIIERTKAMLSDSENSV